MSNILELFKEFKKQSDQFYTKNVEINTLKNQVTQNTKDITTLQDKTSYKTVDVECNHKYEITGRTNHEYNLAIEDSQMIIKKIQGQTKRASENLIKTLTYNAVKNGVTFTTDDDGVITLNGTCTEDGFIFQYANNEEIFKGTFTFQMYNADPSKINVVLSFISITDITKPRTMNWNENPHPFGLSIEFKNGVTYDNYKLYPMFVEGTYTSDTMPAFKPYNNNLVNSKANLISTNRNLFNGKWELGSINSSTGADVVSSTSIRTDYIPLVSSNIYSIRQQTASNLLKIRYYDFNKNYLKFGSFTGATSSITLDSSVAYVRFTIDNITDLSYKTMLNYGSTPLDYEPHQEVNYPLGIELGAYDYIENGQIIRQTSDVITITGDSGLWQQSGSTTKRFEIINFLRYNPAEKNVSEILVKSNWIDASANDTYLNKNGVSVTGNDIHVYNETYKDDLEGFKAWLQANPIQLVYKKATPTTEPILLPAGYYVWTDGLQIQDGQLPYVITKEYAVSLPSQILANARMNISQQEEIDNLENNKINKGSLKTINGESLEGTGDIKTNDNILELTLTTEQLTELLSEEGAYAGTVSDIDLSSFNQQSQIILKDTDNTMSIVISKKINVSGTGTIYNAIYTLGDEKLFATQLVFVKEDSKIQYMKKQIEYVDYSYYSFNPDSDYQDIQYVFIQNQSGEQKNLIIRRDDYLLANGSKKGVVNPVTKTTEMSRPVGVDTNGQLWVKEDTLNIEFATDDEIAALFVKDELIGTWVFNDTLNGLPFTAYITFNSNNNDYTIMQYNLSFSGGSTENSISPLIPDANKLWFNGISVYNVSWLNSAYKTITITDTSSLTNREEFTTWLKANATKET